jgi:Zn-dependent protease
MTIILPLMLFLANAPIFGGAKPVPVNPRNYRNFKKGDIIVSLAGVVTNLVIACLCVPIFILVSYVGNAVPAISAGASIFQMMLLFGIQLNVALAVFNLIPLPPLDGSHVMKYLLPPAWSLRYQGLGRYGLILLFLLISFGRPLLMLWFTPGFALIGFLQHLVAPFLIPSQWTT